MFNYAETNDLVIEPLRIKSPTTADNVSPSSAEVAEGAITALVEVGESPVTEADLTTWEIYEEQLSYHAAVEMDLPVAKVDASLDRQVLIRDVMRYATVEGEDADRDYGVAIRLVITVSAAKLDGELTIPVVAAKAELGMLSAAARLRVIGFKNNDVGDKLPDFATLDVANYGKYTESSDAIRNFIARHPEDIFPILLRTATKPSEIEERLMQTAAASRALRAVADRQTLDSLVGAIGDRWPELVAAATQSYTELAPGVHGDQKPTKEQAELARKWATWL